MQQEKVKSNEYKIDDIGSEIGLYLGQELDIKNIEEEVKNKVESVFNYYFENIENDDNINTLLKNNNNIFKTKLMESFYDKVSENDCNLKELIKWLIVSINMETNESILDDKELLKIFFNTLYTTYHGTENIIEYIYDGFRYLKEEYDIPNYDVIDFLF